jgi:hypothetical protein
MNAGTTNYNLMLDETERAQLLRLLEQALIEKQREEHRSDAIAYRQAMLREEQILEHLVAKVRALAAI